jgi:hypothetical protein
MRLQLKTKNTVVGAVTNIERAEWIDVDTMRLVQFQLISRAADAAATGLAAPRDPIDTATSRIESADHMILCISDNDTAVAIEAEVLRTVQSRL